MVNWKRGQIIFRAEDSIKHLYFPESATVSITAATAEGETAEVGMIGREGIVGIETLLGADKVLNNHLVSIAGSALIIEASILKKEFDKESALQAATLKFIRLLLMQTCQIGLCNRLHSLEARFAKWLLLCHDRGGGHELPVTHDFLANLLAVNRPSMTVAALTMKNVGLINYSRGLLTILDREGLEKYACECYRKIRNEYQRF